jgi:hypothetical protein
MLEQLSVDSMRVRIPVKLVTVIDPVLNTNVMRVHESTCEVLDVALERHTYKTIAGVSISCAVERVQTGRGGTPDSIENCLLLTVHAKMLFNDYLQGITANNLKSVYDFIMSANVVYFDYSVFTDARVTDVDIKLDFTGESKQIEKAMEELTKTFIRHNGSYVKKHGRGEAYTGHQYNKRKNPSWRTTPYMKIYSKNADAKREEHKDFFIQNQIELPKNLWRQEFTLKDSKHMKANGMNNTVLELVSAPQNVLAGARLNCMRSLFSIMPVEIEQMAEEDSKEGIAPRDVVDVAFMRYAISHGATLEIIQRLVTHGMTPANKTKYTQRMEELFNAHIKNSPMGKEAENRMRIFGILGVG